MQKTLPGRLPLPSIAGRGSVISKRAKTALSWDVQRSLRATLALACCTALTGCQELAPTRDPGKASVDGAAELVHPAQTIANLTADMASSEPVSTDFDTTGKLSLQAEARLEYNRNDLVGTYLRESDRLCNDYLQDLTRTQRSYSLIFGSLATVFGGAGAAFTKAAVVRPLSALASISSGERAEVDADTFAKQTAQVIISGIKNSRARTYNTIVQVNFLKPISAWPISVALADVQDYHNRCSLNEGITEASSSINVVAPSATPVAGSTDPTKGVAGRSNGPPSVSSTLSSAAVAAGAAVAEARDATPAQQVASAITGALAAGQAASSGTTSSSPQDAGAKAATQLLAQTTITPPPKVVLAPSPFVVAQAQIGLKVVGNIAVAVDGGAGRVTMNALRTFQAAKGLPVTGALDQATLTALGVKPPAPGTAATTDPAKITLAQQALLAAPLPYGISVKATGIMDAATVAAIVVFQTVNKMPLTGLLDAATLKRLNVPS
jgi:peptidoglycan hydrolase-like protein with peptidoglycan-binding domain